MHTSNASSVARRLVILLVAACAFTVCVPTAEASIITGFGDIVFSGGSTGTVSTVGTPEPNNDNAGATNPNALASNIVLGSLGVTDIEFIVTSSGATTEYVVTQLLTNNTGVAWTDYHFELGFGTGAGFVRSAGTDLLDFDAPDFDPVMSSMFTTLTTGTDTLDWAGASVPNLAAVAFTFAIDVPDNVNALNPFGLNRFTIRQRPTTATSTVPEPSALLLIGIGVAAGTRARRKRNGAVRP